MWQPKKLETKINRLDFSSSGQKPEDFTELWADGVKICNGIELSNWEEDPIQLIVCDSCGNVQCNSGNWLSPRNAGEYILFIPAFQKMNKGSWEQDEYAPPFYMEKSGIILFDKIEYASLRSIVTKLPSHGELKNLTSTEAICLFQWEAPLKVLGKYPDSIHFRKEFFLGSNQESDQQVNTDLEIILEKTAKSTTEVILKKPIEGHDEIVFLLEDEKFEVWQPLIREKGQYKLFISSMFIIEELS